MDLYPSNLLVPTNSRRRTKGRLPFIDSAEPMFPNEDEKYENEVNTPENELEYDFPENPDDVDEEQVTIDLSEFLNDNPLLTEPSENLTDSGATLTDCHSQFRVTSSLADQTPVAIEEISSQKDPCVANEPTVVTEKCSDFSETDTLPAMPPVSEMTPKVLSENNISIDSAKIPTDIVSNISPHKENILIKVKSTPGKYKPRSPKGTNLLQKHKNSSRLKDFNKNNMRVFGKYPVVKCEKLDIENFIKTNSIKVGNWPIMPTSNRYKTKSQLNKTNNVRKYKSQSNKVPKILTKPISFNRCVSNPRMTTVNKARSILIDALAANSSPLIIKTDSWKPEIANLTAGSNKFISPEGFQLPLTQGLGKPTGNQRIIKLVHASSPMQINKLNNQVQKFPIITSVNKVTVGQKTFQLISPNTFAASKFEKSKAVTPILPKPKAETISPVILKDYTVIQPYVEDPTSPVKPKPLLTVPLDIVPVVNAFNQPELLSTATEMHSRTKSPTKSVKPLSSVFLNGAINQISSPVTIGSDPHPINVNYNAKTLSNNLNKAKKLNTDMSNSSKPTMIEIMTSVFSKPTQIKKQPKSKQNNPRLQRGGESSFLGCTAYNSTLNDMIFNDDFTDENYSLDDSLDMSSDTCPTEASNNLQTSEVFQSGLNIQESSSESSSVEENRTGKVFSKQKHNRKKIASPLNSDTLSASEGEEESNPRQRRLSYTKRRHKKLNVKTLHKNKKPTESPNAVSANDESQKMPAEKLAVDASITKNAVSSEKRNKLVKRVEADKSSKDPPESLKLTKEKHLPSNKSNTSKPSPEEQSTTSKSEANSMPNAISKSDKKVNDSNKHDAEEKPRTVQESKIGGNLRSRHKSAIKQQTAIALVKSKRIGYVRAKFKVKSKKQSNKKVLSNNKKLSRPADIIKEIKTITGGSISSKRLQKKENPTTGKADHSSSSEAVSTRSKSESKLKSVSKEPKQTKKNLAVRTRTRKPIKTLKVLFKRPASKQKSQSLEMPFDDVNLELLDNENDPNSLSENNTNLNSTFRDEKSHKMGTPSKEEQKCDADILPTELKSGDSLKENILKGNEMLSNGIDENSSLESSVGFEGRDSPHGESNISTSEELATGNISDKIEMTEEVSENKKLDAMSISDDQKQSDAPVNENLSSVLSPENNSVDSNLALPSTESLSNSVSEDADLGSKEDSLTENSSISVHGLSEDKNENEISANEEIEERDQNSCGDVPEENVSVCESVQDFVCESVNNKLHENHGIDNSLYCDDSSEITPVSRETQEPSCDPDNIELENARESDQMCQEIPESDDNLDNKMVESNEIKDSFENGRTSENIADTVVEPACEGMVEDASSLSEEVNENDSALNHNANVTKDEKMENHVHNPADIDKNINEIDHNLDDNVQNVLEDSKTGDKSFEIEKSPLSEIETIPGKKRGRKSKRKSCPKLKISVSKKADNLGSGSSSQNWYISERKESTDSTQSEEQLTKVRPSTSRRGRKPSSKLSLPPNRSDKDGPVCFETIAEIHAVDTDPNPSEVSDNALSNLGNDEASSEMNKTSVASPATDSSSDAQAKEVSSRTGKSLGRRKLSSLKTSTDLSAKVKKEPMDTSPVKEHLSFSASIKLENEEIVKSMDEITVDTTPLPSRRGRPSSTSKKPRFEAPAENQVQKKVIKKSSPKGNADSPSVPPSKTSESVKTPAPGPKARGGNYSPEAVVVPFSLGWMRELVHRATENKIGKRMSDVYYFSPEGTKLRSMIEISSYLSRHPDTTLTIENFTFFKELIYREPFELERSAKTKSSFGTPSGKAETSNQTSIKKFLQSSKSTSSSNTKSKAKTSVGNSDVIENEKSAKKKGDKSANDSTSAMDIVEDSASSKPSRRVAKKVPFDNSFDDSKTQPRPKRGRPSKSLNPEPEVANSLSESSSNPAQSDNSKSTVPESSSILNKNYSKSTAPKRRLKVLLSKNTTSNFSYSDGIQPPCSPRCHIAAVQRPTVQCAICLCFFHPNCIPQLADKVIYACKTCTTQKLELYEKERSSIASEPLSPEDSVSFDPNVDISLLTPEILLNVQTEPITFPTDNLNNSSSNIPQGLSSGTASSAGVKNVHQENPIISSSPHLLSHLLQPTVLRNSGLLPMASKPTNQNLNNSPQRVLVTKEAAAKILQVGMRVTPNMNISSATPILIKRLPDGRRIAVRASTNPTALRKQVLNANSNYQILSNVSKHVNGNLLSSRSNQTDSSNIVIKNLKIISSNNSVSLNSVRTSHLLRNDRTGSESSGSKNLGLSWDINKLMTSCKALLLVFKRLSLPDLLRASQVCLNWKYVASQSDLWERVSFQGLTITDWEKCCRSLQKNGTKALDLRGIVHQDVTNPWLDLEACVVRLAGIEELIFDQITPSLLRNVAHNLPLLRKLECHFVTTAFSEPEIWNVTCGWELSSLRYLGRLVKLKIGSGSRIELKLDGTYVMPYLPHLRHVALTGFNFYSSLNIESLSKQKELISLELGDCKEIQPRIFALLENLTNLKSLRLENGGSIDDCRLPETLLKIKGLEVLELMNFKISKKLSEAFRELKHLIHLNVWPDNTDKAAVVNRNLFDAISSCKNLKYLCWGVIAEGEYTPQFLEMENSNELTFENLFNDLVALFPEGRVEVKCAPRSSWREFCSTRK